MKELWKPIRRFKFYEISNAGQVRSIDRFVPSRNNSRKWCKGATHKQKTTKAGYKQVGLRRVPGGKKIFIPVHRLVASHFIRPLRKGEVVNHLDFDPANNHVFNLEITTPKGNMQHSAKAGRLVRGTRHHSNKLTESNVRMIRMLHKKGFSMKRLAPEYGVTDTMLYKITNCQSWKHVL